MVHFAQYFVVLTVAVLVLLKFHPFVYPSVFFQELFPIQATDYCAVGGVQHGQVSNPSDFTFSTKPRDNLELSINLTWLFLVCRNKKRNTQNQTHMCTEKTCRLNLERPGWEATFLPKGNSSNHWTTVLRCIIHHEDDYYSNAHKFMSDMY